MGILSPYSLRSHLLAMEVNRPMTDKSDLRWLVRSTLIVVAVTWAVSLASYAEYIGLAIFLGRVVEFQSPVAAAMIATGIVVAMNLLIAIVIMRYVWRSPKTGSAPIGFSLPVYFIIMAGAFLVIPCPLFVWKGLLIFSADLIQGKHINNLGALGAITSSVYVAAMLIIYRRPSR